jgi:endoglycosylceramidase
MSRGRVGRRAAAALVALVAWAPAALAAPREPLGHVGRWTTDAGGRVVILRGASVVPAGVGESAEEAGFRGEDARYLASQGFNVVRLGMFYGDYEVQPGVFKDSYLDANARTQRLLADAGIFTVFDFHQDMLSSRYQGRGFADWFLRDDGFPNAPRVGFPGNYFFNAALNRAYDNLWANAAGLQDHFAEGWRRVAARFAGVPMIAGYDLFNEPWPGSEWPSCANPNGCPPGGFDQTALTAFHQRVVTAIRRADQRHTVYYEPNLQFDVGAATGHGKLADPNVGLSFHNYCLGAAPGLPHAPDPANLCRDVGERRVFENAEDHSRRTGAALLMTEFGDVDDPAIHARMADLADEFMVGWTVWAWFRATGQIKRDPAKPPTADNLKQEILDAIVRPYPQAVSGTPLRWQFDRPRRVFTLAYSSARAGGGRFRSGSESEVVVPRRQYPRGYRVEIAGAEVRSAFAAPLLVLHAGRGPGAVQVRLSPATGRDRPGSFVSCLDRTRPRSRIDRRRSRVTRRRIVVRGRASDRGCGGHGAVQASRGRVARVLVALWRRRHGRCRYVTRRGKLSRRRNCRRPIWLRTRGTRRFVRRRRVRLRRGLYRVRARAVDARGNRARRTRANKLLVRVR